MHKIFTQIFNFLLVFIQKVPIYKIGITILLTHLALTLPVNAQVAITTTVPNPLNISADLAANSASPINGQYTTLGTITIRESLAQTEFGASNTVELNAPTGWTFFATAPHGVTV